jgi:hypothetical protein
VTLLECFTIANIIHQRQKKLLLMPSKQVINLHKPYSFFGAKFTDQYRTVQILMKILKKYLKLIDVTITDVLTA